MKAIIKKWGNSLGIRIPRHIVSDLLLEDGSAVDITEEENRIVIRPQRKKALSDVLDQITDENLHGEEFDRSVGDELL